MGEEVEELVAGLKRGEPCGVSRCRDTTDPRACMCANAAHTIESLRASLTRVEEALREAHKIASDRAFERDAESERLYARGVKFEAGSCKMQGATAAVIANDILALLHANGLSRASVSTETERSE